MKLYNHQIKAFSEFLLAIELPAQPSRMRGRFIKLANEKLESLERERIELLNQFVKRLPNGEPIVKDKGNGVQEYDVDDQFYVELNTLYNEQWILDETEERKDMLLSIKSSVLNYNGTLSGDKALQYDRWCEIVECINY